MEEENPEVLQAAVDQLAVLKESHPELVREDEHPFTECAPFADTIKGQGYSFQSGWHFINLPYLDQGNTLDDYPDWTQPEDDVVKALFALTNLIMDTGDYKSSCSTSIGPLDLRTTSWNVLMSKSSPIFSDASRLICLILIWPIL